MAKETMPDARGSQGSGLLGHRPLALVSLAMMESVAAPFDGRETRKPAPRVEGRARVSREHRMMSDKR
jgi:hypothetical protein